MIDLTVYGERAAIEAAISALAEPWGVTVDWNDYPEDGPHTLRFDTVRIDVRFVSKATVTDDSGYEIIDHWPGANIRISYHGTPAADHLAAVAAALEAFPLDTEVNGITRTDTIPDNWPRWV